MAKKFDTVKDIDGNRETLNLGVRINDLWEVKNRDGGKHIEMVLVDDKIVRKCTRKCWNYVIISLMSSYLSIDQVIAFSDEKGVVKLLSWTVVL